MPLKGSGKAELNFYFGATCSKRVFQAESTIQSLEENALIVLQFIDPLPMRSEQF